MRTWSRVWAVELISIHWNIFTYLMCVHWDYANRQVCLHIWGNSLLSPEWLGNLLVRLPEALTEPLLVWGANLGDPDCCPLEMCGVSFIMSSTLIIVRLNPAKVIVVIVSFISIFFHIKGSDFMIHLKPSQFCPCCLPGVRWSLKAERSNCKGMWAR